MYWVAFSEFTSSGGDASLHGGVMLGGGEFVPPIATSPVDLIIATGRAIGGKGGGGSIVEEKYWGFGLRDKFDCIYIKLLMHKTKYVSKVDLLERFGYYQFPDTQTLQNQIKYHVRSRDISLDFGDDVEHLDCVDSTKY